MAKKILLIGRGHLGSFLKGRLEVPDALHWTREMAELDAAALKKLAPDVVVNTAGKTDLRWCEDNALECWRCNVAAPVGVFRAFRSALPASAVYVHLSSGCVWDGPYGPDGKPFGPDSPPIPACFYSWTKAACDALLLRETEGRKLSILRPRQVYSPLPSPRNTLGKLGSYPKLIDTPNSMTSAETIARTIEKVLSPEGEKALGKILCVYERGVTTPFEVGAIMAEAGLREPPQKFTKQELDGFHKPKRVDTVLSDPFFEALVDPPKVQDELRRVVAAYAKAVKK